MPNAADPLLFQIDSQLVSAIAGLIGLVVVAIITAIIGPIMVARYQRKNVNDTEKRLESKIESAKFAVTNEHKTHLRDDIDAIRDTLEELVSSKEQQSSQITALFSQMASQRARDKRRDKALVSVAKSIVGIRSDVAGLYDRDTSELEEVPELERAIEELENTTPRSTLSRLRRGAVGFADEETP